MEMVLNNGFCEMSQDEMLVVDGGLDIGSAVTGFVCGKAGKWIGAKVGGAVGGPVGAVVGGIIGVAVYECVTHYNRQVIAKLTDVRSQS